MSFKPDPTIFTTTDMQFDVLASRLRELSFLNAGFLITLTDERGGGRTETFEYKGGIAEFVKQPARDGNERLTGFGQDELAARADEQLSTEMRLQV